MLQFCPDCRNPDVEKDVTPTGERTARAACPECGTSFEFPYLPLYLLEGAPSAGKSTTAGHLHDALELTIYEGDMHIDLTGGQLDWHEICDLDFRICMTLHVAGQQTLFVGGLHPHTLAESPETRYFPRIERCALVCDDGDLEARLHSRGMEQEAIDGFLQVNRWYREDGPAEGIEVCNTSELAPREVADRVTNWVERGGESLE